MPDKSMETFFDITDEVLDSLEGLEDGITVKKGAGQSKFFDRPLDNESGADLRGR